MQRLFLLNADFIVAIVDLILLIHLATGMVLKTLYIVSETSQPDRWRHQRDENENA